MKSESEQKSGPVPDELDGPGVGTQNSERDSCAVPGRSRENNVMSLQLRRNSRYMSNAL